MARPSPIVHSPQLRLYLFGAFRCERDNIPLPIPLQKPKQLLAYLVFHPTAHSREQLAALFWGDFPDSEARGSLRKSLSILRTHLGSGLLLANRETVQLDPNFSLWVDALEFQERAQRGLLAEKREQAVRDLQTAADLYRGEFLADFYDDWVLQDRRALRELYLDSLLRLTRHERAEGEYENAIFWARRILVHDVANERAHQHLMFCHLALGNRDAALRQFTECTAALRQVLDVAPSPATIALYDRIKQTPPPSVTQEPLLTNLPIPLSSFIGRQREISHVKKQNKTARLLTLTGAGGSGKSRLAVQVATDLVDSFHDGVWWVELAALHDETLVTQSVAKTLGVRADTRIHRSRVRAHSIAARIGDSDDWGVDGSESSNLSLIQLLIHAIGSKHLLLVLDNCEHLIDACAQLANGLLDGCPHLKILATSREALGIPGEYVWRVPTLTLPNTGDKTSIDAALKYEGIQLFVERARAVKSDFMLTEQNLSAVRQICQALDGIPLAIELAAARVKLFTVHEIAARLNNRLQLLIAGNRTALPRHQTWRMVMDWSYDLLAEEERRLFRRIGVFVGGWTLEAAEKVCAGKGLGAGEISNTLSHLIDKSLVLAQERDHMMRYYMLETIHEYAREKLVDSDEEARIRTSHLYFFRNWVEEAEPLHHTPQQSILIERLEQEHDNVRAALNWSRAPLGDAEAGLRIGGAMLWFWDARDYFREGRKQLELCLARTDSMPQTEPRAKAFLAAGFLTYFQEDFSTAHTLFSQARALAENLGMTREMATASWLLSHADVAQIDVAQSLAQRKAMLIEWREIADDWEVAYMLNDLGEDARRAGDYAQANTFYKEGLAIVRKIGDTRAIALDLGNLAFVARHQGNMERATLLALESLEIWQGLGSPPSVGISLVAAAGAVVLKGHPEAYRFATQMLGVVGKSLESGVPPFIGPDRAEFEDIIASVRDRLSEEEFAAAWSEGRAMTLEQAVGYALAKLNTTSET